MKYISLKLLFSLLIISSIVCSSAYTQVAIHTDDIVDSIEINVDVFDRERITEFTLEYDVKAFWKNKDEDEYQNAKLTYNSNDTIGDRYDNIRIKPRGKTRRKVCSFPPIWINIRKAEVINEKLADTKKIKLVTHCGNKGFEKYILKEYLAYKIYNILSPYSFRVRLARMNYLDSHKKSKSIHTWAFLIEPENMLADRFQKLAFKNDNISMYQSDTIETTRMALFNYMIGNGDYAVKTRHNVKLLLSIDEIPQNVIPVPYDFDYSGLVNAHYAVPGEDFGISSVTERYYNGPCRNVEVYQEVLDDMVEKKPEILKLINGYEVLHERDTKYVTKYIESFYISIQNEKFIERNILSTCVK